VSGVSRPVQPAMRRGIGRRILCGGGCREER